MAMSQSGKTFRIFVSSTFSDLKAERNALQARVFPRLRALAAGHGCRFQVIDLRWGVSEEASLDQQTMPICLGEIERCQRVSPRPNFVVLLGDRYGWQPPRPQIPDEEFRQILETVSGDDRSLLQEWYRLDENAVPPEWRLQPRQRGGPYETYAAWQPVEARLQRILAAAAVRLGFAEERLLPYVASATEQEIAAGALRVRDAPEHVLCFFREIDGLPEGYDPAVRDYLDLDEKRKAVDTAARSQQQALKERLAAYVPGNVYRYRARWTGNGITTDHIDQLCQDVYESLERIILAEIERPVRIAPAEEGKFHIRSEDVLDAEGRAHHAFAEERLRFFVGRQETLETIAGYLKESGRRSLAIVGGGGTGKSALLARAIEQAQAAHPQAQVVYRFIGVTPASADGRSLLESLCREISRRYNADESDIPSDYRDLVSELSKRMALASAERPLLLFLDALDQLTPGQPARNLTWLPLELPEHVSVVVSTRPEQDIAPALQSRRVREVTLGGLRPEDGESLLDLWLASVGRRLQPHQHQEVLQKFAQSQGNPLYLKLAFEEARLWTSYQPREDLAVGVEAIIRKNMLGRLKHESKHGEMLVSRTLGYLAASRYGLAEDELVDLLSRDLQVYLWFFRQTYHLPPDLVDWAVRYLRERGQMAKDGAEAEQAALAWLRQEQEPAKPVVEFLQEVLPRADGPRLPVVLWARLFSDLEPYLTERLVDGSTLLYFYHRELGDVSEATFLAGEEAQDYHSKLADYFRFKADPSGDGAWSGGYVHGLSELPYHLTRARRWDEAYATLTNFRFLEEKALRVGVTESRDKEGKVVRDYTGVLQIQADFAQLLAELGGEAADGGGQEPLIVTARRGKGKLSVFCPVCANTSEIQEEWLGQVISCPQAGCQARLKLNAFVVEMA